MSKNKIIILISSVVLSFFLITVSAAFIFKAVVDGNANPATIELNEKSFLDYSLENKEANKGNTEQLLNDLKARVTGDPSKIDATKTNSVTCYATERRGYTDEDTSLMYLNQLGFSFSFTANIDSYMRIHFEDAWISKKTYNNGITKESYITKAKLNSNKSPFAIASIEALVNGVSTSVPFVYDEEQNYIYIKNIIPGDGNINSYSFSIDESYFYPPTKSTAYREQILVQVSYVVDIVQANRAEARWGVDLDKKLGKEAL